MCGPHVSKVINRRAGLLSLLSRKAIPQERILDALTASVLLEVCDDLMSGCPENSEPQPFKVIQKTSNQKAVRTPSINILPQRLEVNYCSKAAVEC